VDIRDKIDFEAGDCPRYAAAARRHQRHKVTHIVHAAAFVGARVGAESGPEIQVNVMGTVNVLEAARAFDVQPVVFTRAKGVYGPVLGQYAAPSYERCRRAWPKNPQRIYDSAKLMGEQTALYYAGTHGVDCAVLRFATTYGPGKSARHGKMGVTSDIVEHPFTACRSVIPTAPMRWTISSTPRTPRTASISRRSPGRSRAASTNIGSGEQHSLGDIAAAVRKKIPNAESRSDRDEFLRHAVSAARHLRRQPRA